MQVKDTFLSMADWLPPSQIPSLRLVCRNWARWLDEAPWSWEVREPFTKAKSSKVTLGLPQKGEKYSMVCQLGEKRRPHACIFLCVREIDQAIEIKDVNQEGMGSLRKVIFSENRQVTSLSELKRNRFCVGYNTGEIEVFDAFTLQVKYSLKASIKSIQCVENILSESKNWDRKGFLRTTENDLLIITDDSGQLTCWELEKFQNNLRLRWSTKDNHPIKAIRGSENNQVQTLSYNVAINSFHINTLNCDTGNLVEQTRTIKRPPIDDKKTLKGVKLYRNGNVQELTIRNDAFNQNVIIRTYFKDNPDSKVEIFQPKFVDYFCTGQAYVLDDSFCYIGTDKHSNGNAQVFYPKRLPVTKSEMPPLEESSEDESEELRL